MDPEDENMHSRDLWIVCVNLTSHDQISLWLVLHHTNITFMSFFSCYSWGDHGIWQRGRFGQRWGLPSSVIMGIFLFLKCLTNFGYHCFLCLSQYIHRDLSSVEVSECGVIRNSLVRVTLLRNSTVYAVWVKVVIELSIIIVVIITWSTEKGW